MTDTSPAPELPSRPARWPDAQQLRRAAGTIAGVIPGLNARSGKCPTCHRKQDANFTEAEAVRRLRRMVKDLQYLAYLFETDTDLLAARRAKHAHDIEGGDDET